MKQISILLLLALFPLLHASAQKQVVILQTSDTHSRLEPIDIHAANRNAGMGGAVRRAAYVEQARAQSPHLLLFDCGDVSQGTPYYNLFQGEVDVKMMNLMRYDAMAIGNHEFDFGLENMARLFRLAHFPVLCANYDLAGTVLQDLVKPYVILKRHGLKIGVFGISPKLENLVQANKCEGIVYKDPIAAAQQIADLLKTKEKCDFIICLSHLGFYGNDGVNDQRLARQTNHIDIILGGHSHTFMEHPATFLNKDGANVAIVHTGYSGIYVGKTEVTLTKKNSNP